MTPDISKKDDPIKAAVLSSLEAQLAELDLDCQYRQAKIRQSSSMKDVLQLKDIGVRGDLIQRSHEINGPKALEIAAEKRMRELLDGHLMDLRAQSHVQSFDALRGQFLHREWTYLKAAYPVMHREAEITAEKMLIRLERETDEKRKRKQGRR